MDTFDLYWLIEVVAIVEMLKKHKKHFPTLKAFCGALDFSRNVTLQFTG
jgi:hypothetical protein